MLNSDLGALRSVGGRVIVFCSPLLLLLGGIEYGMRRVENSYTKKQRALEERAAELQVLVTGTSVGMYGIDPARLSANAYNVADVSQTVYYDDAIVRPRLGTMPRLRLLIVALATPSLEMKLGDSPEYWRQYWYKAFWGIPLEVPRWSFEAREYSVAALYPTTATLAAARYLFRRDLAPGLSKDGWIRVSYDERTLNDAEGIRRTKYHRSIQHPEHLAFNVAQLSRLVVAARERNVAVALVCPPVSTYYARHRDAAAFGRTLAALDEIASGVEGVRVANYFDDTRFEDRDFYDPDHLAEPGALKFSRIIDDDLVRPLRLRID